jgi:hypothetical protein
MRGKVKEIFSSETAWLAELNGYQSATNTSVGRFTRDMDSNRDVFSGDSVRHTLIPYGLQGGGFVSETGTWNVPQALNLNKVTLNLVRTVVPFSTTVDVERDSMNNSNLNAVATHFKQARIACAKLENLSSLGDGTGLQATASSSTTSLSVPVTGANWDVLLPGTTWDVLTISTGADGGQGLRRLIASVTETTATTGTIVFSTTAQASDGGSGSLVFTTGSGVYIQGSWGQVSQGLAQAAAITGTFENLAKGTFAFWNGTDGRGGVTTTLALSDPMLEAGVRRGRRYGNGMWDFGIGDPAAIDLYKQSKYSQVRYDTQSSTLKSGFSGVVFEGADRPFPLMKEPMHPKGVVRLVKKDDFQMYGDSKGPDFLEDDGGIFRRFSRSLPKEADMLDRWQLGVTNCNQIISFANLDVAA